MAETLAPWLMPLLNQAVAALNAGRLPHALLLAGPAFLGKRQLARHLAARLLCQSPVETDPCGQCRQCLLLAADTHPDKIEITFELNDKGEPRKEILIAQIRRMSEKLVLTPQIAKAQVVLIHPAEAMNRNAANALLKTLEEPPPGRTLILIADQPQRLPATIRSRCQWLRVALPKPADAEAWLTAQGHTAVQAAEALSVAQGNPGLAQTYLANDGLALRRQVAQGLVALAKGQGSTVEMAQEWCADRLNTRLGFACELVRDHLAASQGAPCLDWLTQSGLPAPIPPRKAGEWFDHCLRVLAQTDTTLRQDLQLAALLLDWQTTMRRPLR